jgi:hypothetical protein
MEREREKQKTTTTHTHTHHYAQQEEASWKRPPTNCIQLHEIMKHFSRLSKFEFCEVKFKLLQIILGGIGEREGKKRNTHTTHGKKLIIAENDLLYTFNLFSRHSKFEFFEIQIV